MEWERSLRGPLHPKNSARDDVGSYLWMWCTASSPLPGVVPWSASSSSSSLPVTPSKCPQQNHPNSCLWPSCLSSNFDRKISCSCYISSSCLLPPPSLVDKYTRLLTNLYSCVSIIIETQVYYVEKVLVSLTCMMVYDICCFCAMQVRTILALLGPPNLPLWKPYGEGKLDSSFAFCRGF